MRPKEGEFKGGQLEGEAMAVVSSSGECLKAERTAHMLLNHTWYLRVGCSDGWKFLY